MKHLRAINDKAKRMERATADVVGLQQGPPQQPEPPHIPIGCSLVFSPGWEADRNGGTAGLCQPVERDLFDCHMGCYLARSRARPVEPRARLDREVRRRAEGLAED